MAIKSNNLTIIAYLEEHKSEKLKYLSNQQLSSAPCLIYLSFIKGKGILRVKFCLFCLMQTKDNTSFTFHIGKIADHHLPQSKKNISRTDLVPIHAERS